MAKKFPNWDNPGTEAAKYLLDPIVEDREDEDDLAAMIRSLEEMLANESAPNMSRVTNDVRCLIESSANQLEELKGTLKTFIEEHTQVFAGDIAQQLLNFGFVNGENLCTQLQQQEAANAIISKMDTIIERLDRIQARRDTSVASVVVGEISKNLKKSETN